MQGVYEVASQNNVAIYPVDPRGLPVFEFDIDKPVDPGTDRQFLASSQNTLRALALETDGRAILNRNDLDVGNLPQTGMIYSIPERRHTARDERRQG